jgi:hypothetical protein
METTETPASQKDVFEIIGGPSKFDLMEALFSRKHGSQPVITFKLKNFKGDEVLVEANISALMAESCSVNDREDGDEHLWSFCTSDTRSRSDGYPWVSFRGVLLGLYSTKTRCGTARRLHKQSQLFLLSAAFGSKRDREELTKEGFEIPDVSV